MLAWKTKYLWKSVKGKQNMACCTWWIGIIQKRPHIFSSTTLKHYIQKWSIFNYSRSSWIGQQNNHRIFVPLQITDHGTQIIENGTLICFLSTQTWHVKACSCNLWLNMKTHTLCHVYVSSFTLIHLSDSRPNLLCSCGSILVISACIKESYCGVLCVCCSFKFW